MQPAAFGRVDRHTRLRTAGQAPQRQAGHARVAVPQRRVDRGEPEARDRADRGRVGVEEELAPDRLEGLRVVGRVAAQIPPPIRPPLTPAGEDEN